MRIEPTAPPAAPQGFRFAGIAAGIKKSRRRDMALILADEGTTAAAVFTRNRSAAAPVVVAREHVADGRIRAVVANSGNANAATGREGLALARWSCAEVARHLGLRADEVLPCSTGIIGVPLDRSKMGKGIERAAAELTEGGLESAARAIMTSDAFPKWCGRDVELAEGTVRIAAIAKGAGMIRPDMATMLAYILTDAELTRSVAARTMGAAVRGSFNRITVDGDTSTNDTAVLLASGQSGVAVTSVEDRERFAAAVTDLCDDLSRQMVRDGEGATRVVDIVVEGARNDRDAEIAARSIAESTLFKCALAGADPNWGRILCALGNTRVPWRMDDVAIDIGKVAVVRGGALASNRATASAAKVMAADAFVIRVSIGSGKGRAVVVTSDLTVEYVHFNGAYTS